MKKVVFLLALAWACFPAAAIEYGIAKNYAFDEGIQNDPNVILFEDFEKEQLSDIAPPWTVHLYGSNISFTTDKPTVTGGSGSIYYSSYATIYRKFAEHDTIYMRFYAKYGSQCNYVHHGVWLTGNKGLGYASTRPNGTDYFLTGPEPGWGQWYWDFYTYWPGMADCINEPYWGVSFMRDPSVVAERGKWVCIEFMVKMNTPVSSSNGEQAMWVDGVKKAHFFPGSHTGGLSCGKWNTYAGGTPFPGFKWRTTEALKTDHVILQHYVDTDLGCSVGFDNLVVSTKYIGPATGTGTPPADISPPYITKPIPDRNKTYLPEGTNISFVIKDKPAGVDKNSIVLKVKGQTVTPTITGTANAYTVTYDPPVNFAPGETVHVAVSANDQWSKAHTMNDSYYFVVKPSAEVADKKKVTVNSLRLTAETKKRSVLFRPSGTEAFSLSVCDLSGREVWRYLGTGEAVWNHGGKLRKGVYLVRAEQNGSLMKAIFCEVR